MDRDEAVSELKNRIEHDVSEGGPHPDVPALVSIGVPEHDKDIAVSDGAMEAAEQAAEQRDNDPLDELERIVKTSVEQYRNAG